MTARAVLAGPVIRTTEDGVTREWDAETQAYVRTLPSPNRGAASQAEGLTP